MTRCHLRWAALGAVAILVGAFALAIAILGDIETPATPGG